MGPSARIGDLTTENVQRALARIVGEAARSRPPATIGTPIKSFAKWLYDTHRIREDLLRGVAGFNVKEDPRHERRTISLDELRG